jgi:hypothetical protein
VDSNADGVYVCIHLSLGSLHNKLCLEKIFKIIHFLNLYIPPTGFEIFLSIELCAK